MEPGDETHVRIGGLLPRGAHHFDGAEGAILPQLLVGLVGIDHVVGGEDEAHDVAQPLWLDVHRRGESGVEGGDEPGGAVKVARVHPCERFWCAKAEERVEVADGVDADGAEDDDLPWREAFELGVESADERAGTIAVARGEEPEPEEDDREDLDALELGRGPTEQVVDHGGLACSGLAFAPDE
ncbi:hypothetical protein L1887_56996 [Cichorium endivia]|nr:hypothetical protein L1887_56996 [Cichorium endivia]